jgi:large subunit ribosomal protein L3
MAGRMGGDQVTVKNLEIVAIEFPNIVAIKGAVPGSRHEELHLRVVKQVEQGEVNGN